MPSERRAERNEVAALPPSKRLRCDTLEQLQFLGRCRLGWGRGVADSRQPGRQQGLATPGYARPGGAWRSRSAARWLLVTCTREWARPPGLRYLQYLPFLRPCHMVAVVYEARFDFAQPVEFSTFHPQSLICESLTLVPSPDFTGT